MRAERHASDIGLQLKVTLAGPVLCITVDISVPGGPRRGSCGFSKVLTTMFMAGTFIIHELHADLLFSRIWSIDIYLRRDAMKI